MRKGQTSHKKEHNTRMCFPLKPVFTRDKGGLPNFMDEPTAGLDVLTRDEILDILRDYMEQEDCTILISSHISSDLESLCDDLYIIDHGKIIMHEEMDTLLSLYGVLKVSKEDYKNLDKDYLLEVMKEPFGYSCLTNVRQFYSENYPTIVIEQNHIDTMIPILLKGERL